MHPLPIQALHVALLTPPLAPFLPTDTGLHYPCVAAPPAPGDFLMPLAEPFLEAKDRIKPWVGAHLCLLVGCAWPLLLHAVWADAAFPPQPRPPGTLFSCHPPSPTLGRTVR